MSFNSLFYFLFSPGFYFFLAAWLLYRKWRGITISQRRILSSLLGIFFYITTTPFLYESIAMRWERKFAPFDVNQFDDSTSLVIVVLGSGFNHDHELPSSALLEQPALSRLTEALRITKHFPNARVLTSGYSTSGRTPGALVLKNAAIDLGMDSTKISVQVEPHNTKSEAQNFFKRHHAASDTVLLVTTALHMPRAYQHFKKAGIQTLFAAPCDYRVFKDNRYGIRNFIPSLRYWSHIQQLNKELVGFFLAL